MQYYSTVDYTLLEGGLNYTIHNIGKILDKTAEGAVSYEKPKRLVKQAGDKGIQSTNNSHYEEGGVTVDYESAGGQLHYRVLLQSDPSLEGDTITFTDRLPRGTDLIAGSVQAFYREPGNDYYHTSNTDGYDLTIEVIDQTENSDGTTSVTFQIPGFHYNSKYSELAIYYDVSIEDDTIWTDDPGLESNVYHNEVSWGGESAGVDVTVERDVPELEKSGEQLRDENGDCTDTVRYYIVINQGEKDLVPGMGYITLTDKLDYGAAAGAEFLPSSVRLYNYDAGRPDNHYCGEEVNHSLYSYTYDEEQHVLTFSLLDKTAYVLVYDYVIDSGSVAEDVIITNEVHLQGGDGSGEESELTFSNTSSSATATKRSLTIYKVDATNYGKLLPGAEFTLRSYKNGIGWETCATLTTNDEGKIVLDRAEGTQFADFNFADGVLYELEETAPPPGYTALDALHYFVWVAANSTADQTKQDMIASGALGGVPSEDVQFLTTSGSIYVPNEPSTLAVKKLWYSEDGGETTPGAEEVEIELIRQAVKSNAIAVTITSQSKSIYGDRPITTVTNVARGSNLTITVNAWKTKPLLIQIGDNPEDEMAYNSSTGVHTYTVENITSPQTIYILNDETTVVYQHAVSGFTTPYFEDVGEPEVYKTAKLSGENGWTHTWNDLPKTDGAGNSYYYHVKEAEPVPGFEVIYSDNNSDGVQAGELVAINRSTGGYVLPETGGVGTLQLAAAGTVLMALAAPTYLSLRRKGAREP